MERLANASAPCNPLGIFTSVFDGLSLSEAARAIAAHGLTWVQVDPRERAVGAPDGDVARLTAARAREVHRVLAEHGLRVAALAGYTNLVDPEPGRLERGLRALERMIALCREFGTDCIATETGSLHPRSPWEDWPENRSPAAWSRLCAVVERLRSRARAEGVTLLLEGYVNNVLATTEQARRLVAELGGEGLGFVLDPFNYFTPEDVERPRQALDRVFAALGPLARVAHAKDVAYAESGIVTPRVGAGGMDWPAYAARLRAERPDLPLVLEHLAADEVPGCIAAVRAAFAAAAGGHGAG